MIRPTTDGDDAQIRELLDAAFRPSQYELCLRETVVQDSVPHWEWVWEEESSIVGHILYTLATRESELIGYHLAPVAVLPEFQNRGIGSAIVRESLALDPICNSSVFVLGDPKFTNDLFLQTTQGGMSL